MEWNEFIQVKDADFIIIALIINPRVEGSLSRTLSTSPIQVSPYYSADMQYDMRCTYKIMYRFDVGIVWYAQHGTVLTSMGNLA